MALDAGTRVGPYEVLAQLGEGGMGEVYRARETKLNRDVALTVLPEVFTADPDRVARFKREAHVRASLNHSNIAAIYGFEMPMGCGHWSSRWSTGLPADVPDHVRLLLRRCLEKDRRKRVADISTARFLLTESVGSIAP